MRKHAKEYNQTDPDGSNVYNLWLLNQATLEHIQCHGVSDVVPSLNKTCTMDIVNFTM